MDLIQEPNSPFAADEVNSVSNKTLSSHITLKWVNSFLSRHNIVIRKQSESLSRYPAYTWFIEKTVAYHIGNYHGGLTLKI